MRILLRQFEYLKMTTDIRSQRAQGALIATLVRHSQQSNVFLLQSCPQVDNMSLTRQHKPTSVPEEMPLF